jgi:hypothetical protein
MENKITLISCYFNIKSKRTHSDYIDLMSNLLKNVKKPIVIYCDKSSYELIKSLRENLLSKIIITSIDDFYVNKYEEAFKYSYEIDKENLIHSIDLYKVWNEKINFVKKTIELNPFNSTLFYWIDIGCFRPLVTKLDYTKFNNFPNINILNKSSSIFFATDPFLRCDFRLEENKLTKPYLYEPGTKSIVSGFYGGTAKKMLLLHKLYYETLEKWIKYKRFIGKDGNIFTNVYLEYPQYFYLFTRHNLNLLNHDGWLYFQKFLC